MFHEPARRLSQARSAPTAKLRLAALRHLFDWMVIGLRFKWLTS